MRGGADGWGHGREKAGVRSVQVLKEETQERGKNGGGWRVYEE